MKQFIPLAAILVVFSIVTLVVFIRVKGKMIYKIAAVPVMLGAAIFSYKTTEVTAGTAKEVAQMAPKFLYLGHAVVLNDKNQKTKIHIWTREQRITRVYSIPWTRNTEQQLKQAEQKKQRGAVEMKRKGGNKGKGDGEYDFEYESDNIGPSENEVKPGYTDELSERGL